MNLPSKYQGRTGAIVELIQLGRTKWAYSFNKLMKIPNGRRVNRIECLCYAAWECGMSAKSMNWTPIKPETPND